MAARNKSLAHGAELNGVEGIVQGEENGRVLVQLDHQKGGGTVAVGGHPRPLERPAPRQ